MICKSCGAEVDENNARCPYCNSMIAQGAEKAFMGKLHSMKSELGSAAIDPSTQLGNEAIRSLLKLLPLMLAVSAAFFCLVYFTKEADDYSDRSYELEQYEKMQKVDAISEELDILYEAGDYQAMLELLRSSGIPVFSLYQYDHFIVLEITEMLDQAHTSYNKEIADNQANWLNEAGRIEYDKLPYSLRYSITELFNFAIFNYAGHKKRVRTNADMAELELLRKDAESFLRNEMQLTDEQLSLMNEVATKEGYVGSATWNALIK